MEIYIRLIDLPVGVNGVTVKGDGCFNVYVSERLSAAQRLEALKHELAHIKLHHFEQTERKVSALEEEANAYALDHIRIRYAEYSECSIDTVYLQ